MRHHLPSAEQGYFQSVCRKKMFWVPTTLRAGTDPQQYPQQSQHETRRRDTSRCDDSVADGELTTGLNTLAVAEVSDDVRQGAKESEKAGEGTRTLNIQLGKQAPGFIIQLNQH